MRLLFIVAALAAFLAAGCATPGSGALSPSNPASTTAGGGFGAQTNTGTQAQAQTPQTATAGPATLNWYFASQGLAELAMRILEVAEENGWTPEQIAAVLSSSSGAPDAVTIQTGDITTTSGSPDATGASGGTGGGTTGDVSRP